MTDMAEPQDDLARRLAASEAAREEERRETTRHIRNVLAVMRSLACRTGEEVDTVEDYQAVLEGRISALARIYALPPHQMQAGVDLWDLVADSLLRMGVGVGDRVALAGEPVRLSPKAAGLVGLVIHELALNVALSAPEPVRVEWGPADADWRLRSDQARARVGAARTPEWLERAIEYELGGRIEQDEAGLTVRLPSRLVMTSPEAPPPPR